MTPLPTLRQLRYLVAVVDRGHFSQAAEACFVSQSTLSAGIQELEALLGGSLLERGKRSATPTPLGAAVAERARALLKDAEDLAALAQSFKDPTAGTLHLGVIPTIGPFLLPRAAPALRGAFPNLKLYLREDQSARLLDQLEAGRLDAALLALPYPTGDLEAAEIGEDRFWLICPSDHRFCAGGVASVDDMAVEDLLLLEEGHCLRDHALSACGLEGARRNIGYQGASLLTLLLMVANGLGVTLAPEIAVAAGALRGQDLAALPLSGDRPARRVALLWRKGSGRSQTCRLLAETLRGLWPSLLQAPKLTAN